MQTIRPNVRRITRTDRDAVTPLEGVCIIGIMLTMALMMWTAAPTHSDRADFTDTGVGCLDDCLEPAESVSYPEESDERGTPCTFETCQD